VYDRSWVFLTFAKIFQYKHIDRADKALSSVIHATMLILLKFESEDREKGELRSLHIKYLLRLKPEHLLLQQKHFVSVFRELKTVLEKSKPLSPFPLLYEGRHLLGRQGRKSGDRQRSPTPG
jgi:hypothetical protein